MNVLVIEDERLTAQRLVSLVKKYDASINVLSQISSIAEALSWFKNNPVVTVDLIFMDIHLEDGDSFQIISKLNLTTPVIFTTAFDEYLLKAFKVNSVDYLLKPVNYDELAAALDKFRTLRSGVSSPPSAIQGDVERLIRQLKEHSPPQFKDRFMITVGTKIRSVKTDHIAYFYLEEKTAFLVMHDGTALPIDFSLDKLTQLVDPKKFFRISRQFIVSQDAIQMVHAIPAGKLRIDLIPKSKHEVSVSGDRVSEFKAWLGKE